ncbi:MAG: LysR family transcriptional regulator [Alphaproteobacteria bacterium]
MESLRQIRHLIALARFQSFRKAADHLDISQSTLSESIKRVEDVYGVPLFARTRSGTSLTAFGEIVVANAHRIMAVIEQTKRDVDMLENFQTGHLVVGCNAYLTDPYIAPVIAEIMKQYPGIKFSLRVGAWTELIAAMADGEIDIVFGLRPDSPLNGLRAETFTLPPPVVYCRADHPFLTAQDPASYLAANAVSILVPNVYDYILEQAQEVLPPAWAGFDLKESFTVVSEDATANLTIVSSTDAFSVHHYYSLRGALKTGAVKLLPSHLVPVAPRLSAVLATSDGKPASPVLALFQEGLKRQIGRVWDETPGAD